MRNPALSRLDYVLCFSVLLAAISAFAQPAAFTYQGRLTEAGNPANGTYDMRFKLFDTADVGTGAQQAGTIANSAVPVANGIFTVTLDFSTSVFDGSPRFIEVGVRPGGNTNAYNLLSPRQPVTPTPYAIYSFTAKTAETATTASNVADGAVVKSLNNLKDNVTLAAGANVTITPSGNTLTVASTGGGGSDLWSVAANNAYYNAGNVGIGTANPQERLTITGVASFNNGLKVTGNSDGGTGIAIENTSSGGHKYALLSGGASTGVGVGAFGIWDETDGRYPLSISSAGLVGIGTATPNHRLEVAGNGSQNAFGVTDRNGFLIFRLEDRGTEGHLLALFGEAYKSEGGTSWAILSDRRLKQEVRAFEPGLNEVLQLRPVRFHYRDDPMRGLTSTREEVGFIAQEVREIIPEAVTEGENGYLRLKADPIHWAAINAIQELNTKLEVQRAENAALKQRLEKLEQLMNQQQGIAR